MKIYCSKSEDTSYFRALADGVVKSFNRKFKSADLEYEISDYAITFIESGDVIYIQPLDDIIPDNDDLQDDIRELSEAVIGAADDYM